MGQLVVSRDSVCIWQQFLQKLFLERAQVCSSLSLWWGRREGEGNAQINRIFISELLGCFMCVCSANHGILSDSTVSFHLLAVGLL